MRSFRYGRDACEYPAFVYRKFPPIHREVVRKILTDREIIETFGPSEEGVVKKLLPGNYKEGLELYLRYYKELHGIMCPRPFDGIIPLLEWLKSQNISAAIVTGKGGGASALSFAGTKAKLPA